MRTLRWVAGLLMALLLPGCGSSSPTAVPVPCTQSTLRQTIGAVPSVTLASVPFSVNTAGRLDVTVDWTFPASPIGVYVVTAGSCSLDQFNAQTCSFLTRSETTTKPRKVSVAIAAGNYELLLANAGQDESLSVQVVLSSTSCPAFATAGSVTSAAGFGGRPLSESTVR